MDFYPEEVGLGYAIINKDLLTNQERLNLANALDKLGFALLEDSNVVIVERIKIAIMQYVRIDGGLKIKLSQALETKLGQPYKNLSAVFSQCEGRTIENYLISQRIEYVKELISYGDSSLGEIAFKTGYSSVAYLSKQFAHVVGMTITEYRSLAIGMRSCLTDV
jgi:AraC-like DNA-binding protein